MIGLGEALFVNRLDRGSDAIIEAQPRESFVKRRTRGGGFE
jgi:hypothetical protein